MSVLVNVRQLAKQAQRLSGDLPLPELDLEAVDECIEVTGPLHYQLEVELLNRCLLVRGRLELPLRCTCVRCLKSFARPVVLADWYCQLSAEGEEAYTVVNDCVDLTPYLREDTLLAFPQHPLCEPGCRGLPHSAISSGPSPTGSETATAVDPAWAVLNKLKL